MTATPKTRRSSLAASVVVAVAVLFLAAGCAGVRSESDGATVGRNICKLHDADNQNQADRALRKIDRNLDQARRRTGIPVAQDLTAIDEQLSDLSKHATGGNSALARQDVVRMQRNVSQAISTTTGNTQRFYQGLQQGLSNCDGS